MFFDISVLRKQFAYNLRLMRRNFEVSLRFSGVSSILYL